MFAWAPPDILPQSIPTQQIFGLPHRIIDTPGKRKENQTCQPKVWPVVVLVDFFNESFLHNHLIFLNIWNVLPLVAKKYHDWNVLVSGRVHNHIFRKKKLKTDAKILDRRFWEQRKIIADRTRQREMNFEIQLVVKNIAVHAKLLQWCIWNYKIKQQNLSLFEWIRLGTIPFSNGAHDIGAVNQTKRKLKQLSRDSNTVHIKPNFSALWSVIEYETGNSSFIDVTQLGIFRCTFGFNSKL